MKYGIKHVTSSPEYAQSNGLAERAVQTIKRLLNKTIQDGGDIYLALLELRNTPRDSTLGSPTQRLMGRRTKTLLPIANKLLQPSNIEPQKVHNQLESLRFRQKEYYDQGVKPLTDIKPGDSLRLHTPQGWKPAEYLQKHDSPRSYIIKSGDLAHAYRRNRNRLMVTQETPHVVKPQIRSRRLTPALNNEPQREHVPPTPPRPPDVRIQQPEVRHAPEVRQPKPIAITRSGRSSQKPGYLKDFVC